MEIKCELEQERKRNLTDNEEYKKRCKWQGELCKLSDHINNECPLFRIICEHCNKDKKRYKMKKHSNRCPEKLLQCELKCG